MSISVEQYIQAFILTSFQNLAKTPDLPGVARASFYAEGWRVPLKVNRQLKVNKVKIQFTDV